MIDKHIYSNYVTKKVSHPKTDKESTKFMKEMNYSKGNYDKYEKKKDREQ